MRNKLDTLREYATSLTRRSVRRRSELVLQIAEMLRKRGWNQKELARRADLKESYISRVFSGEANVQLSTICKLEEAFGEDLLRFPIQDTLERRRRERRQQLEEMPTREIAGGPLTQNTFVYFPALAMMASDEYESSGAIWATIEAYKQAA